MTFLPIVGRELRVASRHPASYWTRCVSVGTAMAFGAFFYLSSWQWPASVIGHGLFITISVFAFLYCLGAGMRFTADCISEEKREGTLGLLFLTDLKGYDVVAGKLVATSLNGFYGLVAILPVLAIPLMMGGVSRTEFVHMSLALLNTFFLSLALGMFLSSIFLSGRKSAAGIFLLLVIAPIAMVWISENSLTVERTPWLDRLMAYLNPATSAVLAVNPDAFRFGGKEKFWQSIIAIQIVAWSCLLLACVIVPRSWKDKPARNARSRPWRRFGHWLLGGGEGRRLFRGQLLNTNAFYWLSARERFRPMLVWLALLVMAGFWFLGLVNSGHFWLDGVTFFLTVLIMNLVIKVWVASEAGRRLGEDRKSGALELMLSTPMSVGDILRGQMLAMKRQFLAPILTMVAVETLYLLYVLHNNGLAGEEYYSTLAYGLSIILFLVLDSLALMLLAMWTSLSAANPNRTMGSVIRKVLLLPLILGYVPVYFYMMFAAFVSGREPGWQVWAAVYFFSGLAADLYFGAMAWRRLQSRFREVATLRFTRKPSLWKRLTGRGTPSGVAQ
jgi:ABC-type Na+ efflux pump permease subunit